jgi:hypothetical protein
MTQTTKVKISVANFVLEAYQGEEGILFTHRQIGEAVGKTKEASQRYIKKRESELPPAIKVTIPERKGLIALTQWQSALVFWQYQADMGNIIAQNLIRAIGELKVTDFPIIPSLPPLEVANPIPNHPLDGSIDPTTISPTLEEGDISPVTSDSSPRTHSVSKESIEPKDVTEAQLSLVSSNSKKTQSPLVNSNSKEAQSPLVNSNSEERQSSLVNSNSEERQSSLVNSNSKEAQSPLVNSNSKEAQSSLVNSNSEERQSSSVNSNSKEAQLFHNSNEVKLIADGIEVASQWMIEAGIDKGAIVAWKLKELGKQIPALEGVISSALEIITSKSNSPSGMIVSQLATELSTKMGTKVTPAKINQALHDLELQDWAKPGVNRERKLTLRGQRYGVALLTTSADGWQGAQLRWYDSVIPLLCQYFDG